jgi:hypothetical protein
MIKNFIGLYENTVSDEMCDEFIKHFEKLDQIGASHKRSMNFCKDISVQLIEPSPNSNSFDFNVLNMENGLTTNLLPIIWKYYDEYTKDFLNFNNLKMQIKVIKIQKTNLFEGYHAWHAENASYTHRHRELVWSVYLNDVDEGGETEFLYQSVKFKPKKGSLLIWPASFTHVHRGNPPLSGPKYILTSWIEIVQ